MNDTQTYTLITPDILIIFGILVLSAVFFYSSTRKLKKMVKTGCECNGQFITIDEKRKSKNYQCNNCKKIIRIESLLW